MLRYITSREELAMEIRDFNPDNHHDGRFASALPSWQSLQDYHKRKAEGLISFEDRTPYDGSCTSLTEAYYNFLSKKGIGVINVNNFWHDYLLIPIFQDGKIEVVIFDPSAEQMFYGLDTPYFIGTAAELKGLEDSNPNIKYKKYQGKDITEVFFSRLRIEDINMQLPESAITPALLELFEFLPEQISILTGVVTLQIIEDRQSFYNDNTDLVFYPKPENVGDVIFSHAAGRADNIRTLVESFSINTDGSLISVSMYMQTGDLQKLRAFMLATGIFPDMWGRAGIQHIYEFDGNKHPDLLAALYLAMPEEISIANGTVERHLIDERQQSYDHNMNAPGIGYYPRSKPVGNVVFTKDDGQARNIAKLIEVFAIRTDYKKIEVTTDIEADDRKKLRSFMLATGILPCMWGRYGNQDIYEFDGNTYPHFLEAVENSRCCGTDFADRHKKRNPLVPDGTSMSRNPEGAE